MNDPREKPPANLLDELKRRRVLYAAGAYGVAAFAATEIATFLFENFGVPDWANRLLAALFVAGFPVAMFLSWVFDIGADGVVRSPAHGRGNPRAMIAVALLLLVVATGGLFYLIFPSQPATPAAPSVADSKGSAVTAYDFEPAEKLDNSIAVLPFENLSADPDNAFFSSGVAEEILDHLGAYRELNIIGRTSSFAFGNSEFPAPRISALLGVQYLLQGSVRRHEDQVRVSTRLLDENGVQVWSQSFDRRLTDIFAIQTEIAVAVAQAVVPQVNPPLLSGATARLDAYDLYLEGRDLVYQRRATDAIEALQRSIQMDPDYAPAHAELAVALALGNNADLEAAARTADTALELSPGLLRATAARGLILMQGRPPDPRSAEGVLREVLVQAPHMTDAIRWLANALFMQGNDAAAEELIERGVRTDPLHPSLVRGAATKLAERGEDRRAESMARRVIESPEHRSYHVYYFLFRLYRVRGRLMDAFRIARTWTERIPSVGYTACYCMMIWAHSSLGEWSAADDWIARSLRDFGPTPVLHRFSSLSLRARGHPGEALAALRRTLADRTPQGEEIPISDALLLGVLEALSGDPEAAVATLAPLHDRPQMSLGSTISGLVGTDPMQALAWSYAATGQTDRSPAMLDELEVEFAALERQGTLRFAMGDTPYHYALNALLLGNPELALDRLETIIGWGWRTYYEQHLDPRWDPLRDDPRFQSLMARVKADVDRQRAEVETMESHQDFMARLDVIAAATAEGETP